MDNSQVIVVAMESGAGAGVESTAAALGHHVLPARTIQETLAITDREGSRVIAVFSGIALKDGNWCDLVERLKLAGCQAPVVLCSNEGSAETWWDALEHGVQEVVSPGATMDALERIIKDCTAKGTEA